ncbi:MAG TPA: hypothetical protein VFF74_02455 [Methylophilaceae bacterium]|nr:hypothetical protein [Methylophilaceae bacterium]
MCRLINLALIMCLGSFAAGSLAGNAVTPADKINPLCSTEQNPDGSTQQNPNAPCPPGKARNPGTMVTPGTGITRPPIVEPDATSSEATITPGTGANIKPDVGIPDTSYIGSESYEGENAQQIKPAPPVKKPTRRSSWRELN